MTINLTATQQGIYLEGKLYGDIVNNIGGFQRFVCAIDKKVFREARQTLIRTNDALRLLLDDSTSEVSLSDNKPGCGPLAYHDFSQYSDAKTQALQWVEQQFAQGFDQPSKVMYQDALLKLAENEYWYAAKAHHMIMDGWGFSLLMNRFLAIYQAQLKAGPEATAQLQFPEFRGYIERYHQYMHSDSWTESQDYWLKRFNERPAPMFKPKKALHSPAHSKAKVQGSARHTLTIKADYFDKIRQMAQHGGFSTVHLFFAVLYVYFSRTKNTDDFVLGFPSHNRKSKEDKNIVGVAVNVNAIRLNFASPDTLPELITIIAGLLRQDYRHNQFPLVELNRLLSQNNADQHALFDVSFNYQKLDFKLQLNDTPVETHYLSHHHEQIPLIFTLCEYSSDQDVQLHVDYNLGWFDEDEAQRIADRFYYLLQQMVANPQLALKDYQLATIPEQKLLTVFNQTDQPFDLSVGIHQLFERQVAKTPDKNAVTFNGQSLTFEALNQRANQLAYHLLDCGVKPNQLVGVYLERSTEMLVALLAILKAGGAYLPMDPGYPQDRLQYMVKDASATLIISQQGMADAVLQQAESVILLDQPQLKQQLSDWSDNNLKGQDFQASQLAYVIYTSGSTGNPKGVAIAHSSAVNMLSSLLNWPGLTADDQLLAVTPISFDIHVVEMYLPLICGARVVIADRASTIDGAKMATLLYDEKISVLQATPASFKLLLEDPNWRADAQSKKGLKALIGGEALDPTLVTELISKGVDVWNMYGPTEVTVYSCGTRLFADMAISPIGRPLANTRFYIVDAAGQQQPIGEVGEMMIAGAGLAAGYVGRDDLTAAAFSPNPFSTSPPYQQMYKSGDLGRWLANGQIECLGRIDNQIKIRGFRVELGEIESDLLNQDNIKDCVVVAKEDDSGELFLAAYIVLTDAQTNAQTNEEADITPIKQALRQVLPDYMIPSAFVLLPQLPLSASGKLNRKALPEINSQDRTSGQYVEPQNITEQRLCSIWQQVLGLEKVGTTDNFFELGGHSLMVTRVIGQVRQQLAIELPFNALFEQPTIADLALWMAGLPLTAVLPPITVADRTQPLELSFAQQRLWFIHRLEAGAQGSANHYNMAAAFTLTGPLNEQWLQHSFQQIVERHQVLRSVLVETNGHTTQQLVTPFELPFEQVNLTEMAEDQQRQSLDKLIKDHGDRAFDLTQDILLRVLLIQLKPELYTLAICLHHIAADGWSAGVIIKELSAFYAACEQDNMTSLDLPLEPPLEPLAVQYADFARWQRDWLQGEVKEQQLQYWRSQLKALPQVHSLVLDKPRPPQQSAAGATVHRMLNPQLTAQIQHCCQQHDVTLFMLLQSAFALLLHRYSGDNDIVMGSPVAGRSHSEIEPLIGMFVNTLVLRTDLSQQPNVAQLLHNTRQMVTEAYEHQHVPFEMLVDELKPERSLSHSPLFQLMFSLQDPDQGMVTLADINVGPYRQPDDIAKFDVELNAQQQQDKIELQWTYCTELFFGRSVQLMADNFEQILLSIVTDSQQSVATLPMIAPNERQLLTQDWSGTAEPVALKDNVLVDFETWAEAEPQRQAVSFNDVWLSYGQLNQQANQLAHYLLAQGITANTLVGLSVDRSLDMVVGLLAILKAGGAYVPMDANYPAQRIAYMLADSQVKLVLSQSQLKPQLPLNDQQVLCLDDPEFHQQLEQYPKSNPVNSGIQAAADDLAYVIYTSGSSGEPKGVLVQHQAIATHIGAMAQALSLTADDQLLQMATINFDTSVEQTFMALGHGCALFIYDHNQLSTDRVWHFLADKQVTVADFTPSFFNTLTHSPDFAQQMTSNALRLVTLGGEALNLAIIDKWQQHDLWSKCQLINAYGPTEVTVTSTLYELHQPVLGSVPIGRPVAGVLTYVLDNQQQLCPAGGIGELYLGGPTLALGYLNLPQLSEQRFIEHPELGRLYQSGDLVRYLVGDNPQGDIEFIGRADEQVKVRGYRVELGEIETQLSQLTQVQESVVVPVHQGDDNHRLVAYIVAATVVSEADSAEFIAQCQQHLSSTLPVFMLPSVMVLIDSIPLTANGKVDKKALPQANAQVLPDRYIAPQNDTQTQVAAIWSTLLGVEKVSVEADFFALGGQSLLLMNLISALEQQFDLSIDLKTLFGYSTVVLQADYIDSQLQLTSIMNQLTEPQSEDASEGTSELLL